MTILFLDQIQRKTHRSRKQHIASNGSENAKKEGSVWIMGKENATRKAKAYVRKVRKF